MTLAAAALIFRYVYDVEWLNYVALGLLVIALASGFIADKISWAWLKLSEILGMVMPKIFLSLIFRASMSSNTFSPMDSAFAHATRFR